MSTTDGMSAVPLALRAWLRRKDMKLEKRGAGEYDVVGLNPWDPYYGTARKLGVKRWIPLDDGGRMRERPFMSLDACARFIAREGSR